MTDQTGDRDEHRDLQIDEQCGAGAGEDAVAHRDVVIERMGQIGFATVVAGRDLRAAVQARRLHGARWQHGVAVVRTTDRAVAVAPR